MLLTREQAVEALTKEAANTFTESTYIEFWSIWGLLVFPIVFVFGSIFYRGFLYSTICSNNNIPSYKYSVGWDKNSYRFLTLFSDRSFGAKIEDPVQIANILKLLKKQKITNEQIYTKLVAKLTERPPIGSISLLTADAVVAKDGN